MKPLDTAPSNESSEDVEVVAERKLEEILEDPENSFLEAHATNISRIDSAETSVEALAIAESLIMERLKRTFEFKLLREVEGVELASVNVEGIKSVIDSIKANQLKIGEGGDAYVVIDKNEIREFPPEVCYKFAKEEETARGRNSMSTEADIHGDFYAASEEVSELNIGVPIPMYVTEMGQDKILAMEKLPAKSVDDILRGLGRLPDWLDIDEFVNNLKTFLEEMHSRGLYHRDMHLGNVMVSQAAEVPEDGKWGYVIDFGLSGHGQEGMEPYKKEVAGTRFTYSEDGVIINALRRQLHDYRDRNSKGI